MALWDNAAESKMELMMCQHVTGLNASTFPLAQFESENVLSLMWSPTMRPIRARPQTLAAHIVSVFVK